MRILITGGHGMLGRTLQANWHVTHTLAVADLPEVDVTDPDSLRAAFDGFRPEVVVHCAAKTNVDACESDREGAFRLNAEGSANVARACAEHGVRLLAISTDYVFAGDRPGDRSEDDPTAPKTVYGASKLAGEEAIRALCPNHVIARTAWLYGPGGPSFVHAILPGQRSAAPSTLPARAPSAGAASPVRFCAWRASAPPFSPVPARTIRAPRPAPRGPPSPKPSWPPAAFPRCPIGRRPSPTPSPLASECHRQKSRVSSRSPPTP